MIYTEFFPTGTTQDIPQGLLGFISSVDLSNLTAPLSELYEIARGMPASELHGSVGDDMLYRTKSKREMPLHPMVKVTRTSKPYGVETLLVYPQDTFAFQMLNQGESSSLVLRMD